MSLTWQRKETHAAILLALGLLATLFLSIFWGWKRHTLAQKICLPFPVGLCCLYQAHRMWTHKPNAFNLPWLLSRLLYFLADILLSFTDDEDLAESWRFKLSLGGIISFIIGHTVAVVAMSLPLPSGEGRPPVMPLGLIPVVLSTAGFMLILGLLSVDPPPDVAPLAVVGGVYIFMVCTCAWRSFVLTKHVSGERSFYAKIMFAGWIIFVIDDMVNFLGIEQFRVIRKWPHGARTPIIIFPYTIAQYMLMYATDAVGPKGSVDRRIEAPRASALATSQMF